MKFTRQARALSSEVGRVEGGSRLVVVSHPKTFGIINPLATTTIATCR